jgi:GT2 family glycosyltransferase
MINQFQGHFDHVIGRIAIGWAWNSAAPQQTLTVELVCRGQVVAQGLAGLMRDELVPPNIGTGRYGFALVVPEALCDGQQHPLQVRVAGSAEMLPGGIKIFNGKADLLPMPFLGIAGIVGQLDELEDGALVGWIMDRSSPAQPIRLALFDGERFITSTFANQHRGDVKAAGFGTGDYGFRLPLPAALMDGKPHRLNIRQVGSADDLLPASIPFSAAVAPAANPPPGATPAQGWKGKLEAPAKGMFRGWVWNARQPEERHLVELHADGRLIGTARADQGRPDLLKVGIGDGSYGFSIPIPAGLIDGKPHAITCRVAGANYQFGANSFSQSAPAAKKPAPAAAATKAQTVSPPVSAPKQPAPAAPKQPPSPPAPKPAPKPTPAPVAASKPASRKMDGSIDLPGYLDGEAQVALLGSLPLEHRVSNLGRMNRERAVDRLLNRLKRERMAAQPPAKPATHVVTLILLVADGEVEKARRTIAVWGLQSHNAVNLVCVPSSPTIAGDLSRLPVTVLNMADADQWQGLCRNSRYLAFARAGDVLHPSLATVLSRQIQDSDVVVWNLFSPDAKNDAGGWLYRRPKMDGVAACHAGYIDTTFAASGRVLADLSVEAAAKMLSGDPHLLLFWLGTRPETTWANHPEALTIRAMPVEPDRRAILERSFAQYEQMGLRMLPDFSLEKTASDLPVPFVLLPTARAKRISVVICYRDYAAMTLRCLHSVARQRVTGSLEIVLVNNQSKPSEQELVLRGARQMFAESDLVVINYDQPFNHSDQNNLGAKAATGDVVVICNNDMVLRDDTLLEEMAAWALRPGYGVVGCQIYNTHSSRGAYAHRVRALTDDAFGPVLYENEDPTYQGYVTPVPGNSLCLGAMARDRFLAIGGLDAVRFPIGYNDVDFALRCRMAGLSNFYLGHLRADHERGSSRTGDNEDLQILLIRSMYPCVTTERLFQLQRERLEIPAPAASPQRAAGSAADIAAGVLAARQKDAARDSDMAKALANAITHMDGLQKQLDAAMKMLAGR